MSLIEPNNLREEFEAARYSDEFCAEHNIDRSINLEMVDIILTKAEKNGQSNQDWKRRIEEIVEKLNTKCTYMNGVNEKTYSYTVGVNAGIHEALILLDRLLEDMSEGVIQ